jgi:APA family basic amino acid/polyamine antiporter
MNNGWRPKPGDKVYHPHRSRQLRLRHVLGVPGLFSAAYANVGSSIYYALGVVALAALGLTPPVLIASGIFFLFTALTYAEGAAALPESGGSGAFAREAFNDLVSFIASWALMIDYIVTISISAFSAANYLGYFIPALHTWPTNSLIGVAIVAILAVVNIGGIKESSGLNVILAFLVVATQVTLAVLGVMFIINLPTLIQNIHWGVAPTTNQLLFGISISMIGYTGIETVANLGGETKQPSKNIPRAVLLVFAAVLLLYTFLSTTALSAYPVHQNAAGEWGTGLTQYLDNPVMGIAYAMPPSIQPILCPAVAILAVIVLVIATNAGILGASRLAYFMGVRKQLPPIISQISTHSRAPRNAIIMFCSLAILLIAAGRITLLADLYAFGAMLAYTSAHVSIIALRIKQPDLPRPFKIGLNIHIRKREIPITAIIGGLATGVTWIIVAYTHQFGRVVGFIWIVFGLIIYCLYRRKEHLPLAGSRKEQREELTD